MKVGDLVKDEFKNIGVVLDTAVFGNGPAVHVQFDVDSGYGSSDCWILESLLEVINE